MKIPVEVTRSTRDSLAGAIEQAARERSANGDKGIIFEGEKWDRQREFWKDGHSIAEKLRSGGYSDEDVIQILLARRQAHVQPLDGVFELPLFVTDNGLGHDLWRAGISGKGKSVKMNGKGELYVPVLLGGSVNTPHDKCDFVLGPDGGALAEVKALKARFNDCAEVYTLRALSERYSDLTTEIDFALNALSFIARHADKMPEEVRKAIPEKITDETARLDTGHVQHCRLRTDYESISEAVAGNGEEVAEAAFETRSEYRDRGLELVASGEFIDKIEERKSLVKSLIWREKGVDVITHAVGSDAARGEWESSHVLYGVTSEEAFDRFYRVVSLNQRQHKIHPRPVHRKNKSPSRGGAQVLNAIGDGEGPAFIHVGSSTDLTGTISDNVHYDILYESSSHAVVGNLRGELPYEYDVSDSQPKTVVRGGDIDGLRSVDGLVEFARLADSVYGEHKDNIVDRIQYLEKLVLEAENGVIDFDASLHTELKSHIEDNAPLSAWAFQSLGGDEPRRIERYIRRMWEHVYSESPDVSYETSGPSSGPFISVNGASPDPVHVLGAEDVISGNGIEITRADIADALVEHGEYRFPEELGTITEFKGSPRTEVSGWDEPRQIGDVLENRHDVEDSKVKKMRDSKSRVVGFELD